MQIAFLLITLIEILITALLVRALIRLEKQIEGVLFALNQNSDSFNEKFIKMALSIKMAAKFFSVFENYKDSIKEFKNLASAIGSVKKIIDTYNLISGLKTAKKFGLFFLIRKLLFKK